MEPLRGWPMSSRTYTNGAPRVTPGPCSSCHTREAHRWLLCRLCLAELAAIEARLLDPRRAAGPAIVRPTVPPLRVRR